MRKTKEMIKDDNLWAGLNGVDMPSDEADITVFGIPFDGGVSYRNGAKEGPSHIRSITYSIAPTTEDFELLEGFKVCDLGDIEADNRTQLFEKVESLVEHQVSNGNLFMMIGGDHSTTIPVLRGIDKALDEDFGIIHIDAHFDLCDTLEGDSLSHGSTERRALELNNITGTDNLFFIGIRSIEVDEYDFMQNNHINVISARDFYKLGTDEVSRLVCEKMSKFNKIYLTLDIDCLDPAYAAGTGTPQFGGLTSRQVLDLLRGLFQLPIIGFDIVEVAPKLDTSLTSVYAARKIITEAWGHIWRKTR